MDKLFFDGFGPIFRIVVAVPVMYFIVMAFVRLSGKRTNSQMNGSAMRHWRPSMTR